jgi:phenylacetate-CoA ligase
LLIEEVLGCRVINRYGSAEFGVAAYEGPDETLGRMRLLDSVVHAETLPAEGGGQELVLTGLLNPAMPLLRYRTGDLAELVEDDRGRYMLNVSGRLHDLVEIGGRVWPTHYIQDRLDRLSGPEHFGGGVDDFQIEVGGGKPILRLVPMTVSASEELIREVGSWWPDQVRVECVSYDELRRVGRQNKFRYVVEAEPASGGQGTGGGQP